MLPTPQFTLAQLAAMSPAEFQRSMQPVLVERMRREALLDSMVDALTGGLQVQDEVATAEQTLFVLDTTPGLDPEDEPRVQLLINGVGSPDFTVDVEAPSLTYTGTAALGAGDHVRILVWPATAESDPLALQKASNLTDLANVAAARAALELGTAAVRDVGGASGVAGLDASGFLDVLDGRNLVNVPQTVPGGGDDGDVLTSNGAGGYAWEALPGSGGLAETSITVSSGNVAAMGSANMDFAIPGGASGRFLITEIRVERTAGTGTTMTFALWADDARSTGRQWLIGSEFSSGIEVNPGPIFRTRPEISASIIQGLVFFYRNEDATAIIRATVYNPDGANDATYEITLYGIPLG